MSNAEPCGQCQLMARPYSQLYAPFLYEFPTDQLITGLKFQRRVVFARAIAEAFEPQCSAQLRAVDLLVPVPLHWSRHWRRGFNQSELILRFLCKDGLPPVSARALLRKRRTRAQSSLDLEARQANVAGAFVACEKTVAGKSIGLLDDVVTTGATVSQAGEALLSGGALSVCVFAIARAA
ncbi:MAG: ComF family protein [Pseudomonadota bacterium]